ncbi:MAG: VOC family protein [Rhodomicrobium sp.]
MGEQVKAANYGTVSASLVVRDAKAAMNFYEKVFGAKELYHLTMPDGGIAHAEFKIGDTVVMIADERSEWGSKCPETLGGSSVALKVMVDDPDVTVAKAEAEGGKSLIPVADQFYGFRSGRIQDRDGHLWIVSKLIEEVSPDEMQKRIDIMVAAEESVGGGG